jgi:transposase
MTQFTFFLLLLPSWHGLAQHLWKLTVKPVKFDNHEDGFASFLGWLKENSLIPEKTVVCMENTGVYSEGLS